MEKDQIYSEDNFLEQIHGHHSSRKPSIRGRSHRQGMLEVKQCRDAQGMQLEEDVRSSGGLGHREHRREGTWGRVSGG
jgi:hypothetical protein